MRHKKAGRKLGRTSAHRKALFKNLAISLIEHGRIRTTVQKAKELRVFADRLVSLAKKDNLHARRLAFDRLRHRDSVVRLFNVIAPAFKGRNGGYTRILKIAGHRPGDTADMAYIEYLSEVVPLQTGKVSGDDAAKDSKVIKAEKSADSAPAKKTKKPAAAKKTEAVKKAKPAAKPKAKKSSDE